MTSFPYLQNKKILLTGGAGFLGHHVVKQLLQAGIEQNNIFIPRSNEYDLRKGDVCEEIVKDKDIIIHLAAKVGGIGYNRENPATLFYENLMMGVQLMDAAWRSGVKKFVAIGTICAYPKYTPAPFKESELWNGYPEETNAPYGLAKKMMLVQAQAYRAQYGFNAVYLLPVNLYGPYDNFNPNSSHVIPALIKKIAEAKATNAPSISVWGTGTATREFLFVDDAAQAIIHAANTYNEPEPINIGSGKEISIRDLTTMICKILDFKGSIEWDATKPDGQPRRMLDTSQAEKAFGFRAKTDLRSGLEKTIDWYLSKENKEKI